MNILLIFPGFIIAFIIVLYYKRKVRNLSSKTKNNVHFYVVRDNDDSLWLYLSKPYRYVNGFNSCDNGCIIVIEDFFSRFGLNPDDFKNLKFEDEPVEVFLNLEN